MRHHLSVAVASVNQTPMDWGANITHLRQALAAAKAHGAQVLCLPELCITGYACEDAFFMPDVTDTAVDFLLALLPDTQGLVTLFGLPLRYEGRLYNVMAIVVDGQILGFVPKQKMADDGVHYEPRWFKAWPSDTVSSVMIANTSYPIGDLIFDIGGVSIGIEICRDAWVADRTGDALIARGVDLLLNPTGSHFALDKIDKRYRIAEKAKKIYQVPYLYANLVGNEAGQILFDGDLRIVSPNGACLEGPRFSLKKVNLLFGVIEIHTHALHEKSDNRVIHDVNFVWKKENLVPAHVQVLAPAWEQGSFRREEEFTRAVAMGLYDYLTKTRHHGFVINVSGGADSAACLCLIAYMLEIAEHTWGFAGLKIQLAYIPAVAACHTRQDILRVLCTGLYQATDFSSETTKSAAIQLTDALGIPLYILPIQDKVDYYAQVGSQILGRPLNWEQDDLVLQNIQPRVRSTAAWVVANMQHAILLVTSNRSELAVGYATMDGDTCGGLAPLGGIDKPFIQTWLRWVETLGPTGLSQIPALAAINRQAPTAELRPAMQQDEKDLMPYEVLNAIEGAFLSERLMPLVIFQRLHPMYPDIDALTFAGYIRKFFKLWAQSQWKRMRSAPAFRVDMRGADAGSGERFPIFMGNFAHELQMLDAYLKEKR